jgi:Spy/CpxP family protein refolding chaperone
MNDLKLSWGSRAKCSVAIIGMILVCASGSLLAQHAPDAIAENFYPPELIRQAHQAIGLTAEQEDALKSTFQKAQERITDLQQRMKEEAEKLAALAKKEKLDENGALAQADKVLNLERDIKRAQVELLIKIKNTLTSEQQAKLRELKGTALGLQAKMRQAQELVQKWKDEGRDLSSLAQTRDELEALMKEGRLQEAESLLEKTIKILSEPKK